MYRSYRNTFFRINGNMKYLKPIGLLLTLVLLAWVLYLPATREFLLTIALWAESRPLVAAPLYLVFLIVAVVLMFPVWGVLMIGGYLFGSIWGALLAWFSYQIGAFLAFVFARTIGRNWVSSKFSDSEKFQKFETAISRNGFKAILLMRSALIFPANLINLFGGISAIKQPAYIFSTALGSIPLIILYTFLGAKSSNLISALADGSFQAPKIPSNIVILIFSVVIIVVGILVFRSKRKKLSK